MIWNSSQWICPGKSGGALKVLLFLVLVLKLKSPELPWRLAELHRIRPSPQETQRGAAAQWHIHNALEELLLSKQSLCFFTHLPSIYCDFPCKSPSSYVLQQRFYINHIWLWEGNFTSPLTCAEQLRDSAHSKCFQAGMRVEDLQKYEDDSYTGYAELWSNLHQQHCCTWHCVQLML